MFGKLAIKLHAARLYATECRHFMRPSSFQITTAIPFVISTNWSFFGHIAVIHAYVMQPDGKNSNGFKMGTEQAFFQNFLSAFLLPLYRSIEVPGHVVVTFVLVL